MYDFFSENDAGGRWIQSHDKDTCSSERSDVVVGKTPQIQ